ncbi:MAG: transcription repressor NadR [Oscillospiraceae bacterium]|nr:transcription repressor NadR [Oscillospiraceae bacterium]
MTASNRREKILAILYEQEAPVSASSLAAQLGVSRQLIVGDIALLRAGGEAITSTPRGYLHMRERPGLLRQVACLHDAKDMAAELYAIVDNGCDVLDVVVEHPVYGQLTGQLQLHSRYDVDQFIARVAGHDARPLSALTDGVHLHTLYCPDESAYQRAAAALRGLGFLFEK